MIFFIQEKKKKEEKKQTKTIYSNFIAVQNDKICSLIIALDNVVLGKLI